MRSALDGAAVLAWCELAVDSLTAGRGEIDALNVFPVADRDTGTNLLLTMESAAAAAYLAAAGSPAPSREALLAAMADGALAGACGNSGTIVAQLLGGFTAVPGERAEPTDAKLLAHSLRRGAEQAQDAVAEPVEGTVLTVARAAAQAALDAASAAPATVVTVADVAARAAEVAVARTTDQLDVLAAAGVVDAGGRGWAMILDALHRAVGGGVDPGHRQRRPSGQPRPALARAVSGDAPAYEVAYLLDASADRIGPLRADLAAAGESVVVSGGPAVWRVHVHTVDAGGAVEAGIRAGRPRAITITALGPDGAKSAAGPGATGIVAAGDPGWCD